MCTQNEVKRGETGGKWKKQHPKYRSTLEYVYTSTNLHLRRPKYLQNCFEFFPGIAAFHSQYTGIPISLRPKCSAEPTLKNIFSDRNESIPWVQIFHLSAPPCKRGERASSRNLQQKQSRTKENRLTIRKPHWHQNPFIWLQF